MMSVKKRKKIRTQGAVEKFNSVLGFFILFVMIPFIAQASALSLERDLQKNFKKSRILLTRIERALVSGASYQAPLTELRKLGSTIRTDHQALLEQFRTRGRQLGTLSAVAVSRHTAMQARYGQSVSQYLAVLEGLSSSRPTLAEIQQLKNILAEILPKKKRRIHGTTPYYHLNLPARTPQSSPEVVPAYRGGSNDFAGADLAASPEAPLSLLIAERAESLNWNPVEMYEWVKNNIETEWYWGVMKGAEETLRQRSGNDADQAALLVALFRAAGFPARYVRGVMEFFPDIESAREQIGLDDPAQIARFFQKAGIPYETVITGGRISNFRIEHIWVEVEIPYDNYRGTVIDAHGRTWLALDTGIKVAGFTKNTPGDAIKTLNLSTIRESYLTGFKPETPLEYLTAQLNDQLAENSADATYDDLLLKRTINQEHMQIIPASLQFTEIAVTGEYASLPDELMHKARFIATAADGTVFFDQVLPIYKLSNRTITLTFEPETIEDQEIVNSYGGLDLTPLYLIQLRPVITIDGAREIVGRGGLAAGSEFSLAVELAGQAAAARIENTLTAGYPTLVALVAQQVVESDPVPLAEKTGIRLFFERAMAYIDRGNRAEEELASLLQMRIARPLPTLITLGGVLEVVTLSGSPQGYEWKGVYLDADLRVVEPIGGISLSGSDPASLFMQMASLQNSVLEHRVFEDGFEVESVSTAKLIGLARDSTIPVAKINAANISATLPSLNLPESIEDDIVNSVNQGYVVTLPNEEMLYEDWSGFVWIKEHPTTFESGWMLSGTIAGGMTALNPARWPEEYYDRVTNPGREISQDPSAAIKIKIIKGMGILHGTVGQKLAKNLQVVALARDGKRVKGVDVRFRVRAGGGLLRGDAATPWQTEVMMTTNGQGFAQVEFLCNRSTGINPTTRRKSDDNTLQRVDETVIEVTTTTGLRTTAPITVYGFPDAPEHLRVEGGGTTGPILTWGATLRVFVEDKFDNPINEQQVEFTMGEVQEHATCPSSSGSRDLPGLLVGLDDPCMKEIPVYGECGKTALSAVTALPAGASALVILGGLPDAAYPVTVSSGALQETVVVNTQSTGPCNPDDPPYLGLALRVLHTADGSGNIIDGGAAGSSIPLMARLYFIREETTTVDREISCFPGTDTCPVPVGTGKYFVDTNFVSASVMYDGQEARNLGNGRFRVNYDLPGTPGKRTVTVTGTAATTVGRTVDACTGRPCVLVEEEYASPPVSREIPVYAVEVTVPQEKYYIPVDEDGYVTADFPISYTITPADYTAAAAHVALWSKKTDETNYVPVAYFTSKTSGQDRVTFLRGFRFEQNTAYKAQVVLNDKSEYMEVKSKEMTLVPLTLELDADLNHDGIFSEDDPVESMAPGLLVPKNSDDDDKDGVPDYLDGFDLDPAIPEDDSFSNPANLDLEDDDLIAVKLHSLPADFDKGTVTLKVVEGQDKIRILADSKKEIGADSILIDTTDPDATATQDPISASFDWQLGSTDTPTMEDLPSFIYIEGVNLSVTSGDIQLAISFTPDQGSEIKTDTLVLSVVNLALKVDEDRDGKIVFDDPESPESSYLFWVNNDHDKEHKEEGEYHEDDEKDEYTIPVKDQDWHDDYIGRSEKSGVNGNKRDLEDFAMIQLRIPKIIYDNPDLTYSFKFDNVVDDEGSKPSVNLFKAVDRTQLYLEMEEMATKQIKETKLLTINTEKETPITREYIAEDGAITPFIFEGRSKGAGDLKFLVKNGDNIILETSVHLELHDIRWFYDEFKVDIASGSEWRTRVENNYQQVNQGGYSGENEDYFLFVHGWNVTEAEKKRWTETAFKRLWWQGYRGKVGLFNWPCLTRPEKDWVMVLTDPHNFNNSDYIAWQSATSLFSLLQQLKNKDKQLTMLAHSQGNIVAGEALAKYPSAASKVNTYIASQAALSSSFYDNDLLLDDVATTDFLEDRFLLSWFRGIEFNLKTPRIFGHYDTGKDKTDDPNAKPYFSYLNVASKVSNMFNFYNSDDYGLSINVFELNNVLKPEYGLRFVRCDDNDVTGNYDIFEPNCVVNGEVSGEKFVDEYYVGDELGTVLVSETLSLQNDLDRYRIFSYIVHARKRALGTQNVNAGGFHKNNNVDLKGETFGFNDKHYSHSRQFRSNIVNETWYWKSVLLKSGFANFIMKK